MNHSKLLGSLGEQMSSSTDVYSVAFYSCHKTVRPPPLGLLQTFALASGAGRLLTGSSAMPQEWNLALLILWAWQQSATRGERKERG